jgi:serine/threonine-protein kinase
VSAPPSDPLVGQLIDARYRIDSRIARGGMATVYRATDTRLDRPVAVKILHPHLAEGPKFVDRFRREARAAARLVHSGIVAVYDQGTWGGAPYLVMELVEGPNLRTLLTESGLPPVGKALDLVCQALEALAVAHTEGFVHRDIKPENILLTTAGRVKVADFGLARAVSEVTAASSGVVLGTVAYLSPELIAEGVADKRADIYAFGVVLFELLTGTQPFQAEAPIQVAFQHVHSDFPAPSSRVAWLPQEIDSLVLSLAAKDPKRRPEDATAALALVRAVRAVLPPEISSRAAIAPPPPPLEPDPADKAGNPPPPPPPPGTDATADGSAEGSAGGPGGPVASALGDLFAGGDAAASATGDTDALQTPGTGGTRALPLATLPPPPPPAASTPAKPRKKRGLAFLWWLVPLIVLAAGGGSAAVWYFQAGPGSLIAVPHLVGQTREAAEEALKGVGLGVRISEAFDDSTAAGRVVSSDPNEGQRLAKGQIVNLVISKGVEMATIPEEGLVGQNFEQASEALRRAGFDGEISAVDGWSTTEPAGRVLAVDPPPGQAPHNATIKLTVSNGPEPAEIPKLTGLTMEEAAAEADKLEMKVVQSGTEYSEEVPEGQIISQTPEQGASGHRGDQISVVTSLGMPFVTVPNVVDLPTDQAIAALEAQGLKVNRTGGLVILNRVSQCTPGADERVRKGSTVTIVVV